MKNKTKGILLIAINHPYYGDMAYNLALSIKKNAPNVNISILKDINGIRYLQPDQLEIFDKLITCPDEYTTFRGRKNYLKPKVYLNHFTPYDCTLYLDVDMILTPQKSIETLLNELEGVEFTMQNRGYLDLSKDVAEDTKSTIWAKDSDIKNEFNFKEGKLYNLSSEVIYFENTKNTKALFIEAQKLFESPKVKYVDFADGIPDELPFSIAMVIKKMYPHQDNWRPIFWESFDRVQPQEKIIYQKYYGISLGGNIVPNYTRKIYLNLVSFYGMKTKKPLKNKRDFLENRKTI